MTYEDTSAAEGKRAQLFKGLAELALLSLLRDGACYGLEILDRLRAEAGLSLAEGTIYPLLHRMERARLVAAEWRLEGEGSRPRKYYVLTDAGVRELEVSAAEWRRISDTLNQFLNRSA